MIYLDNSATTHIDEEILDAMLPWMRDFFGNPSSAYALGRKARVAIEEAREEIAASINAHPAELLFTSGGTEANNAILKSCCIESGLTNALAISAIEHHAVSHPSEWLAVQGFTVKILGVDSLGIVEQHWYEALPSENTLISIMQANNETGVIQQIDTIRAMIPEQSFIHTDAVQSFGKIPIDVQQLGIDFLSLSAHKIHGPKGIGAMYIRKGIDFKSHQHGGGQERNRRAGTESPALIVGFQIAVRNAIREMESRHQHMRSLQLLMRSLLKEHIPQARINTPENPASSLPSIMNVSFQHINDGEAILQLMDMAGIAVSNGSACVSGSQQPSHVLKALGLSDQEAKAAVRFSFSKDNTEEEITEAVLELKHIIASLS
ncbi:MAG: cysteine desulfurase family protein [Ignavibacteria bacterium]